MCALDNSASSNAKSLHLALPKGPERSPNTQDICLLGQPENFPFALKLNAAPAAGP